MKIRKAEITDVDVIQTLSVQLGYSPSRENLLYGLEVLLSHPDYEIVVIEDGAKVAGWMSLQIRYRIEDVPFLQVIGIVTDEAVRGKGFGKRLLAYAEEASAKKKLPFVGLYSSQRRKEAHAFYRAQGYSAEKESVFFVKRLE